MPLWYQIRDSHMISEFVNINLCIQQTRKKRILTLTYLMGVNANKNNHCLCFEPQFILISAYYWLLKKVLKKILNAVH
jgi:hypothetical protein